MLWSKCFTVKVSMPTTSLNFNSLGGDARRQGLGLVFSLHWEHEYIFASAMVAGDAPPSFRILRKRLWFGSPIPPWALSISWDKALRCCGDSFWSSCSSKSLGAGTGWLQRHFIASNDTGSELCNAWTMRKLVCHLGWISNKTPVIGCCWKVMLYFWALLQSDDLL